MSRRLLAAGLLTLTFAAACSDDPARPSRALPAPEVLAASPDDVLPGVTPSDDGPASAMPPSAASVARAPSSAPAAAPAPVAAPQQAQQAQQAQPKPQQTSRAVQPAAGPSPARTATKAPAPSPRPSPTPAPAQTGQVALSIQDFAFNPRVLTVPVGSTVTVTNKDEAIHDWTSDRGVWGSGDLRQGQTFSYTFTSTGMYNFLCERHSYMTGTVNVTPG